MYEKAAVSTPIPIRLQNGDTLSIRGRDGILDMWRVMERKLSGYLLKPLDDRDARTWSDDEIDDAYVERRLTHFPFNIKGLSESTAAALEKTWEYWKPEVRRLAERRLEYVRRVDLISNNFSTLLEAYTAASDYVFKSNREAWTLEDEKFAIQKASITALKRRRHAFPNDEEILDHTSAPGLTKPNPYTVRAWYQIWSKNGRDIRLLIPLHHKRGHHKPRYTKARGEKLDTYKLMQIAAETYYFNSHSFRKNYAYEKYVEMCEDNGINEKVSQRTFRNFLYKSHDDKFEYIKRYGRRAAYLRFGIFERRTPPDRPLEEVEVDHCLIDLMIVHPVTGKVLGRPWLTAIIDRATRVILGVNLSFEQPSYASLQRAIAHALWPKDLSSFDGLDHGWPCHGVWDIIFTDNGKEFRGNSLKTSANLLDFSLIPLPAKSPWLKGIIERFWRTIGVQVFSHEEGATQSRAKDHYDPGKRARLTLAEVQKKILKWIVDEYHENIHSTLGSSPMQKWLELTAIHRIRPVPSFEHVIRLTGEVIKRKVSNVGVMYEGLLYADKCNHYANLKRLIERRGGQRKDWLIRVDPYDLGGIWIMDDQTGEWLDLPCVDQTVSRGVSKYQHRVHVLIAKRNNPKGTEITIKHLEEARRAAEETVDRIFHSKNKTETASKAARYNTAPEYFTPINQNKTILTSLSTKVVPAELQRKEITMHLQDNLSAIQLDAKIIVSEIVETSESCDLTNEMQKELDEWNP